MVNPLASLFFKKSFVVSLFYLLSGKDKKTYESLSYPFLQRDCKRLGYEKTRPFFYFSKKGSIRKGITPYTPLPRTFSGILPRIFSRILPRTFSGILPLYPYTPKGYRILPLYPEGILPLYPYTPKGYRILPRRDTTPSGYRGTGRSSSGYWEKLLRILPRKDTTPIPLYPEGVPDTTPYLFGGYPFRILPRI